MLTGLYFVAWVFFLAAFAFAKSAQPMARVAVSITVIEHSNETSSHGIDRGFLIHVQTTTFELPENAELMSSLSSLLVNTKGTELLATSRTGHFLKLNLSPTQDLRLNVTAAEIFPMITSQRDGSDAEGLSVNGVYEGNGQGELYVSFGESQRAMKFMNGVNSQVEDIRSLAGVGKCAMGAKLKAILKLHSTDGDGLLLLACGEALTLPTLHRRLDAHNFVFSGWAYNETSGEVKPFYIMAFRSCSLVDMAQLPDGDVIMIFRYSQEKPEESRMLLVYITAGSLHQAISTGSSVMPQTMGIWPGKDNTTRRFPQGLAVRQDEKTKKIFVYIIGAKHLSDSVNEGTHNDLEDYKAFLSVHEWQPTPVAEPTLPPGPSISRAGGLHALTVIWIPMAVAFSTNS
ncbi:hypothetical protein FOL47_004003 [Perkinsus chesapeaki]|uniref:Uncharacterized protein n=1 Tax=Perkinsus chesapeaki TaxID=330153 RepID=A0A7J6M539_PERCH|nr:hypothetical protein FOL47_004003 [Perkinsus chesapeaki]